MRIPALGILTIFLFATAPATAQRYDPAYPVCLQSYGIGAFRPVHRQSILCGRTGAGGPKQVRQTRRELTCESRGWLPRAGAGPAAGAI